MRHRLYSVDCRILYEIVNFWYTPLFYKYSQVVDETILYESYNLGLEEIDVQQMMLTNSEQILWVPGNGRLVASSWQFYRMIHVTYDEQYRDFHE